MAKRKAKGMAADIIASATGKHKEPSWEVPTTLTKMQLSGALNFYSLNSDDKQKQKWALDWIAKNRKDLLANAKKAPTWAFSTYAALMRMESRGAILEEKHHQAMIDWAESLGPYKKDDIEDEEKPKKPASKKEKSKHDSNMQAFDDVLDDALAGRAAPTAVEIDPSQSTAGIIAYCNAQLEVIKEDSRQYPKHMKVWFKAVLNRAEDVQRIVKTRKVAVRKPRKIDPMKMVAKVRYLKNDADLGVDSIKPVDVIGKKKVYLFDVKYRRLTKLIATDAGFVFSGTSFQNIDLAKSTSKTLRKPSEVIKGKMGIRELDRAFGLVKGKEFELTGQRTNENLLILAAS